ncbi:MAG TPA: site-specific integrase [Gemmatimonadales bacterium]|nr:site-specific integrase [Gemmatimonadales bacterium]
MSTSPAPKSSRAPIASYGAHGARVRVVRKGARLVAEWYVRGDRRERSWPDTRANVRVAKEWAETFARERVLPTRPEAQRLTNRALWELYQTSDAWAALRERSRALYTDAWNAWELFAGRHAVADDTTSQMILAFHATLKQKPLPERPGRRRTRGLSVNSIRQIVGTLKTIHAWAEEFQLIGTNRWRLFKQRVAKNDVPESPAEYTDAEYQAVLAQLDPARGAQWRAWVALVILGAQGVRQVAGLQLRWADLDLAHRRIHWPKETDKMGKGWSQPLRQATVRALRIARNWARRQGVESPYVLYAGSRLNRTGVYSPQSLWWVLQRAEERAGVRHLPNRAAHGLRRLLSGNVNDLTGNIALAMRAIGDKDLRMANRYLKKRDREVERAFREMDRRAGARQPEAAMPAAGKPAPHRR